MTHQELVELFRANPVISAVSCEEKLSDALEAPSDIIFLLTGDLFSLGDMVARCKEASKLVFLHLDLIKGFSRDSVALKYIKNNIGADGVISTKVTLLKAARSEGLYIIQRLFMLDSTSYKVSIHTIENLRPDAIEIMPGIMPKIIQRTCKDVRMPVIAGGLIDKKEEVITGLKAGATSISTSKKSLWYV